MTRQQRQQDISAWAVRAFGTDEALGVKQRALRFLEEAIELYQACDGDLVVGHKLLDYVFNRPVGAVEQELGGAGVTLLALAHAAGYWADDAEANEARRVLSKPIEEFTARNELKNQAGFLATK